MALAYADRRNRGRRPRAPGPRLGNWKLAYADFLTALVALFLVLWLVSDAPSGGRTDIAEFFRGQPDTASLTVTTTPEAEAAELAGALRATRRLTGLSNRLQILAQGDRVRIDLFDRTSDPLFESGGAALTASGRAGMAELADVLATGSWPVEIEGHTDAFPATGNGPDNWSLSSERAQSARHALLAAGLDPARIRAVTGLADTVPLRAEEPHLAANRRITLVLQVAR